MREILFRGKREIDGKWIYGSLIQTSLGHVRINGTNSLCEVDPDTVGQFTGVTDKKSRKIFEGDIIDIRLWGRYVVIFDDGSFCYVNINDIGNCDYRISFADNEIWANPTNIEVIGNIHDNPELLEVEE